MITREFARTRWLSALAVLLPLVMTPASAWAQAAGICEPTPYSSSDTIPGKKYRDYPAIEAKDFKAIVLRTILDLNLAPYDFVEAENRISGRRLSGESVLRQSTALFGMPATQYSSRTLSISLSLQKKSDSVRVRASGRYGVRSLHDPCFYKQLFAVFENAKRRYETTSPLALNAAHTETPLEAFDAAARVRLEAVKERTAARRDE